MSHVTPQFNLPMWILVLINEKDHQRTTFWASLFEVTTVDKTILGENYRKIQCSCHMEIHINVSFQGPTMNENIFSYQ